MKKYLNFLLLFLLMFTIVSRVNATSAEATRAYDAIRQYCFNDGFSDMKGCHYDKNDTLYTRSGKIHNENFWVAFNTPDLSLTRGYQGATKDGEIVFAGCYKGHTNGGKYISAADYYVFKIVKLSGKTCKKDNADIVFAKGTTYEKYGVFVHYGTGSWNGNEGMGSDMATYVWTAKNGGSCPYIFGVTANTKWYTSGYNKYVFADDKDGVVLQTSRFWDGQHYEATAGCSVQDEEGFNKAVQCYEDAMMEITNKQCPSDLKNIDTYRQTLTGLANKCSGDFEVLYKVDLLKNNATIFKTNLTKAANDKLTACQYSQCNLTASEISNLTNRLSSSSCKDGCAGKTGSQYDSCFSCLKGVFNSCGLPSNKIQCLVDSQKDKDEALQQLAEEVAQEQEEHIAEEVQEGEEIMEQIYHSYEEGTAPTAVSPGIGSEVKTCQEILGKNLTKIVHAFITIIQIASAIIAIVKGMMILIPPIVAKDADALKKASSTLILLGIVLVIVLLFKPLIIFLGRILELDVSCIV